MIIVSPIVSSSAVVVPPHVETASPSMFRIPTFLLPVLLLMPAFSLAADPAAVVHTIDVGIAGHYKNGCCTPVHVAFSPGKAAMIRLETVDSDGVSIHEDFPVTADENSRLLYARLGRATAPLHVSLLDGNGQTLAGRTATPTGPYKDQAPPDAAHPERFTAPVPMTRPVYLVVGRENIGLLDALSELRLQENRRPAIVQVESLDRLPGRADGYEAVELIVLTTSQPELFDGLGPDSPQILAMEEWMRSGGHVFLVAGRDAAPLLQIPSETPEQPSSTSSDSANLEQRLDDGPLYRFLPGRFRGMTDVRQGEILQIFAGSRRPLVMTGSMETPFLRVPLFDKEPGGAVLLRDGSLPLVMRTARGFGCLTYMGGDLHADPLLSWNDRGLYVATIFGWKDDRDRAVSAAPSASLMHFGYEDVAGQLRSALDEFDGATPVRFSLILTVLALYVLAVGGLDWLLVRKILRNSQWTRLTYPLWIFLFCVVAYILGGGNHISEPTYNQVALLDYDPVDGRTRLSSWYALYSPADARFDLEADIVDGSLTWNGLSGSGLGGMDPKTFTPGVWQEGYEAVAGTLREMPVAVRSTKSLFARGRFPSPVGVPGAPGSVTLGSGNLHDSTAQDSVKPSLQEKQGIPVGTVANPFDFVLEDVRIAFGRWVLDVGRIEAGETVDIGPLNRRFEMQTALYDRLSEETVFRRSVASYQTQSKDVLYILRAVTLHEAAGGFDAVGLNNRYQGYLEMSNLLKTDRAVLVAKAPEGDFAALRLTADKEIDATKPLGGARERNDILRAGRRDTVVRMVLPVVLAEKKDRPAEDDTGRSGLDSSPDSGLQEHYELPPQ